MFLPRKYSLSDAFAALALADRVDRCGGVRQRAVYIFFAAIAAFYENNIEVI
jgi:hypothetical protein